MNRDSTDFHSIKIASGQVKKYLGQRRVNLLFTAGQKYAQVGSGPISTPMFWTDSGFTLLLQSAPLPHISIIVIFFIFPNFTRPHSMSTPTHSPPTHAPLVDSHGGSDVRILYLDIFRPCLNKSTNVRD